MKQCNSITILAIETSCDDTCIAIVKGSEKKKPRFDVLSNIVSSQVKIHEKWGGVYPTLAKREHQRNLAPVLKQALLEARLLKSKCKMQNAKLQVKIKKLREILKREEILFKQLEEFLNNYKKPKVDVIAVTIGPGLEPCLWVGVNFARALAYFWDLPIVPVNHIEAHILANFITSPGLVIQFPAICLIVSGGHTQLILMNPHTKQAYLKIGVKPPHQNLVVGAKRSARYGVGVKDFGKYKILGETRDDAVGECFDKVARILGLGYPGGPAIATLAAKLKTKNYKLKTNLPRPMIHQKNYDFSFSGLKTAVFYNYKSQSPKIRNSKKYIQQMSAEVQQAIIDVLLAKTIKSAKDYKAKTIILGGGVASNEELRKQFAKIIKKELPHIQYLTPNIQFCTDNAAMIGATGYFQWLRGERKKPEDIEVNASLRLK